MKRSIRSVLRSTPLLAIAALAVLAAALAGGACGGSSPSAPAPAITQPAASLTVTITATGVSPRSLQVPMGGRVTFVNSDSRTHEMNSDPHPVHTDCPEINAVSFLAVGQSKQTDPLNTVRTCGFHDHNQPTTTSLQGTIRIQ